MTEENKTSTDKTEKKEKSTFQNNKSKNHISYSKKAYKDGYNFSSLSEDEQEASKYLYHSEEDMSNFYAATCTMTSIIENQELTLPLRKGWGFPNSGIYSGFILDCKMTDSLLCNEYIMEILLDERNVRFIKFTKSLINSEYTHIYNAIKETLNLRDTIFRSIDYGILKNMPIQIGIENIELDSGKIYSKVNHFMILSDYEYEIKLNLIRAMFKRFAK